MTEQLLISTTQNIGGGDAYRTTVVVVGTADDNDAVTCGTCTSPYVYVVYPYRVLL